MDQEGFVKPDVEDVTTDTEQTLAGGAPKAPLKAWSDPVVSELEISRTAFNPSFGSDGGTGDCQHV